MKLKKIFIYSCGLLLLLTAIAKIISSGGTANLLRMPDPVFKIPFRDLFVIVGIIELAVAGFCFIGKNAFMQALLLAWLAGSFVLYRCGLSLIDYAKPCSCLGQFTSMLAPATAEFLLKSIIVYIGVGSICIIYQGVVKSRSKAI